MSSSPHDITPFDGYGNDVAELGQPANGNAGALVRLPGGQGGLAQYDPMMGGAGGGMPPQGAVFKKIHQSLRGRYVFAIILGLILGIIGGYAGYKSQKPVYRAESLIQIRANVKNITNTGFISNFDELLQSEALTVSSRKMIRDAMRLNDPKAEDWSRTGLGVDAEAQAEVAEHLVAEHPARTEYIRVYYTHQNKDVAAEVVKCITRAYHNFFQDRTKGDEFLQLTLMAKKILELEGKIKRIDEDILKIAREFGDDNLPRLQESLFERDQKLLLQLRQAEFVLEVAKSQQDAKEVILNLNVDKIGMLDQRMRELLLGRDNLKTAMEDLKARGVLAENQQMKLLQARLDDQNMKIDRYAADWRDLQRMYAEDPSIPATGIARLLAAAPPVLERQVKYLKGQFDTVHAEMLKVGQRSLDLKQFHRDREDLTKEKSDYEGKQTVLMMDAKMGSRLNIITWGDVSPKPFKDRRKMAGVAGAFLGFGLPLGIFVLLGLMDRRYRYTDDADQYTQGNVPLLGILPRLPSKLTDPEQAAVAAHCIHQIRIMLQVGGDPETRRVFMVTSGSTGDGKTSLTLALGLSFAASGSKTLVIDCDMVGQGLTHRLKAHNVPGLIETLNQGTLRGHVRKTATKGLYVLPIGNADAVHAGVLSPLSIKRLLVACREHFDVIVIDTGPILGSLEASVVAPEADGIVMAVARGQQQPLVDKAIRMLRSLGGNVLGIVFNRAEQRDFQKSVTSASIRSLSSKPHEARSILPDTDESARFGPLARSVASCLPSSTKASSNGNGHTAVASTNGNGSANGAVSGTVVTSSETAPVPTPAPAETRG